MIIVSARRLVQNTGHLRSNCSAGSMGDGTGYYNVGRSFAMYGSAIRAFGRALSDSRYFHAAYYPHGHTTYFEGQEIDGVVGAHRLNAVLRAFA